VGGCDIKLDYWNKWISLGANLAVFAGLVLVAYELAQGRTQLELSATADGSDNFVQAMELLAQDEDLAGLIYEAEFAYDQLDEFQRWRLSKYLDGFLTMSEQDHRVSIKTGDLDVAAGMEVDWRENMTLPMYREYWDRREQRFGDDFRRFINGILEELEADKGGPK
jgi:hypothetical protein